MCKGVKGDKKGILSFCYSFLSLPPTTSLIILVFLGMLLVAISYLSVLSLTIMEGVSKHQFELEGFGFRRYIVQVLCATIPYALLPTLPLSLPNTSISAWNMDGTGNLFRHHNRCHNTESCKELQDTCC